MKLGETPSKACPRWQSQVHKRVTSIARLPPIPLRANVYVSRGWKSTCAQDERAGCRAPHSHRARDCLVFFVTSTHAYTDENRKVIVDFGGFPALFACFEVSADTVSTHGDRQSSDRPCSSSAGVRGGGSMRHAAAVVDVMEEQPLKHLTSIVSLKKAASKLHRRTRYYAIKRLAVEAIANLLIEKENQSAFVELSGVSLFRNLIRTNEVFYQEQKRICVALFNLSKNEKMRKLLYEKGLMLILRDVVDEGTTDLIVSVLRALRNCAGPIFRDEGLPKAAKKEMDARQTISWTAEDIKFVSSLLLRSQDVRCVAVCHSHYLPLTRHP